MQNKREGASPKATPMPMSQFFSPLSCIPSSSSSGGSVGSKRKEPTASTTSTAPDSAKRLYLNRGASVSANTSMSTHGGHKLTGSLEQTISSYLNAKNAAALSTTSKQICFFLQHRPAIPMGQRKLVHSFLRRVVRGQDALMKQMLDENIEWLFKRERVTDCSGREFDSISGFEYALWALDKHQWDDMFACLPRDGEGHLTEKSLKVVAELKKQYAQVKSQGVIYKLNGIIKTESHYDFAIIGELQKQLNAQNAAGVKNWNAIDRQWREGVGGAQRLCPMHVVDEYCSTTPFGPVVPTFNSRPQPAKGLRRFYSWLSTVWESWGGVNSKLGVDFAIIKTAGVHAAGVAGGSAWVCSGRRQLGVACLRNLGALEALCETRTKNFSALEAQMNSLCAPTEVASSVLGVDAQHRPGM